MNLKLRSGKELDFYNIDPSAIDIDDICWGLAGINRWTGQGKIPYYVSDHTLYVHHKSKAAGAKPDVLLLELIHDTPEAYTNDMSEPVKRWIRQYTRCFDALESKLYSAIKHALGVPHLPTSDYKTFDFEVREHEQIFLFMETTGQDVANLMYFGDRFNQANRAAILKETILQAIMDYKLWLNDKTRDTAPHPCNSLLRNAVNEFGKTIRDSIKAKNEQITTNTPPDVARDKALFSRRQAAKLLTGIDLADDVPFMYFPAVK